MPASLDLSFRPATAADAPLIAALVNSAYRGDSSRAGWTTEADLIFTSMGYSYDCTPRAAFFEFPPLATLARADARLTRVGASRAE